MLKRNLYLTALPLLIIASIISLYVESIGKSLDIVNKISLPILIVWLCIFLIHVGLRKNMMVIEVLTFIFLSVFHLYRFYFVITDGLGGAEQGLDEYMFWMPLFYIYIYLIFRRKIGLYFSLVIYSLTLLMGIYELFHHFQKHISALDTLTQFYLSSIVYIVGLYFLNHLVAVYMESETLRELAYTDFLTNLPNRRTIEGELLREFNKAKNSKIPLSVIILDIDDFKKINDTFGHDVGDSILIELSDLLKKCIRDTDYIGRWGGEEFVIMTPNQNRSQAVQLANRLRQTIENHLFPYVGSVTSSFGVTELKDEDDMNSLFKRVDQALYASKSGGKNQVTIL
ncbi:GGDEF domain-containing protein [Niallia sp. Krafla_26]|uniref:GGDEF domain-containing protein n=1 Tax=Niallia sp. Krafla_26 TaxID=3064703 RepID=UPI003D17B51C